MVLSAASMRAVKEGDGNFLDNSIVLYGSGMKDGNGHVKKDLPLLVAGKGGGALKQGQLPVNQNGTSDANLLHTMVWGWGWSKTGSTT